MMSYMQQLFDDHAKNYVEMGHVRVEVFHTIRQPNDQEYIGICESVVTSCKSLLGHTDDDLSMIRFINGHEAPEYVRLVLNTHLAEAETYLESARMNRWPNSPAEKEALADRLNEVHRGGTP